MSVAAINHVWDATGVTAEEKLALLWIANTCADLGEPVCPEWISLGEFIGVHYETACDIVYSLADKGLIVWGTDEDETAHVFWLVYDGEYRRPIEFTAETKSRSKRVAALIERDGPGCAYCGKLPVQYEVDHFIPRAAGGPDKLFNLVLACSPCNRAKRHTDPDKWLADRPEVLRQIKLTLRIAAEEALG